MDAMSRTIAALGVETVRNMVSLRVLVLGMRGVGVETAKNVVLGRVAAVTVWDPETVEIADLGANFYLRPEHVGKVSRADASVKDLADLNPYVQVRAHGGELTPEFVRSFGVVVVTADLPRQELVRLNEVCRTNRPRATAFILAQTHGVTGTFFTDFGDEHTVTDADGEPVDTLVVDHFDPVTGRVKCVKPHGLEDGATVRFAEFEGTEALNAPDKVRIRRIYNKIQSTNAATGKVTTRTVQLFDTFTVDLDSLNEGLRAKGRPELGSLRDLGEWVNGGLVTEVKPSFRMPFRPLAESLRNPCIGDQAALGVPHPDQERWMPEAYGGKGTGSQLHFAYLALLEFRARRGALPALHSAADADECVAIAREILAAHKAAPEGEALVVDEIREQLVRQAALFARAELSGYCAFLGGVAAQELVKVFGKYTPHHQWLQSDHLELLPEDGSVPEGAAPRGTRYDHQVAVLGAAAHERITNQRWFLIGCGALGCEYMKAIALMGVGTGPDGGITTTDMDRIELSNLSRQFLFRSHHIGKPKSVCASEVARGMNPELKIRTHEGKVAPETEDQFDDAFWDSLTGVWNALDNIHARKYSDRKCLLHGKPLLESGTMGTAANSEVIIPHVTSSYNDHKDQDVAGIAACTLRNFPSTAVHCIEWAKPLFETEYALAPQNLNKLLEDRDAFLRQVAREGNEAAQAETLEAVKELLESVRERTFGNCVRLAFARFNGLFRSRILDLVHHFPADTRVIDPETKADLGAFWSGAKRFPTAAEFSADDELHLLFLQSAANLFAFMMGIPQVADEAEFRAALAGADLSTPEWKPPARGPQMDGEDVATSKDAEEKADGEGGEDDDEARVERLVAFFREADTSAVKPLLVSEFEKDDDTNFHISFITAAANLRARNYRIQEATRHRVKVVAGKIIAALATTTAMVTGLVSLSYYGLVLGLPREKLFNSNPNLARATYSLFNPTPAVARRAREDKDELGEVTRVVAVPDGFTSWDHVVIDRGDLTVREFVDAFPDAHHGVKVTLLFKAGISQADIDAGGVRPFYSSAGRRNATMAENMLKRDNLSDAMRARFQAQVDAAAKHNAELEERLNTRLVDLYTEQHGDLPTKERNYLLLAGDFQTADGEQAEVPLIKYVFKK